MEGKKELGVELTDLESHFDSRQLDQIQGDGVNIQCINSSEFVVGKQTNFNGPVTIINCPSDSLSLSKPSESHELEKIVIKDKILSEPVATIMNKYAERKSNEKEIKSTCHSYNSTAAFCFYANFDGEGWRSITEIHLQKPVQNVVISQTEENACFSLNHCISLVRSYHSGINNLTEIGSCHFYAGGDGNFYENPSKHLTEKSPINGTINICLMGYFDHVEYPTYPQIKVVKNFLRLGVENNWLKKDYGVLAAHSVANDKTSSLYNIIKKWKGFKSDEIWVADTKNGNSTANYSFVIYHKEDWKGLPAKSFVEMKLPVPYVVISHSVTPRCFDPKSCFSRIKNMQSYHLSLNLADLAHNFCVDSNGNIYEGRGWNNRNTIEGFVNGRNIDINFIGDYSVDTKPTENQLEGVKQLIQYGVENGKISQNYSLIAANSTYSTLSPGKNVYAVIKNWPHFDPHPESHVTQYDDN